MKLFLQVMSASTDVGSDGRSSENPAFALEGFPVWGWFTVRSCGSADGWVQIGGEVRGSSRETAFVPFGRACADYFGFSFFRHNLVKHLELENGGFLVENSGRADLPKLVIVREGNSVMRFFGKETSDEHPGKEVII